MKKRVDTSKTVFDTLFSDINTDLIFKFAREHFAKNKHSPKLDKKDIAAFKSIDIENFLDANKEDIINEKKLRNLFDKHSILKVQEKDGTFDLILIASNTVYRSDLGHSVHIGAGDQGKVKQALSEKHGLMALKIQECIDGEPQPDSDIPHIDELKNEAEITEKLYGYGAIATRKLYLKINDDLSPNESLNITDELDDFYINSDNTYDDEDGIVFDREDNEYDDGDGIVFDKEDNESSIADLNYASDDSDESTLDQEATHKFYFTMPLLPGKPLDKALVDMMADSSPKAQTLACMLTLIASARALDEIHGKNIIHADLKPGNILVNIDDNMNITAKIIDFGFSIEITGESSTRKIGDITIIEQGGDKLDFINLSDSGNEEVVRGTQDYHHMGGFGQELGNANEVGEGKYTLATDIFALGRIGLKILQNHTTGEIPDDLQELLDNMTHIDLTQRPKASAVIQDLTKITFEYYLENYHELNKQNICRPAAKLSADLKPSNEKREYLLIDYNHKSNYKDNVSFADIVAHNRKIIRKLKKLTIELEPKPLANNINKENSAEPLTSKQKNELRALLTNFIDNQNFKSNSEKIRFKDFKDYLYQNTNNINSLKESKIIDGLEKLFEVSEKNKSKKLRHK